MAVKTFIHQGTDPEVIRFNAVSLASTLPLKTVHLLLGLYNVSRSVPSMELSTTS